MAGVDVLVLGDCNPDLVLRGKDVEPVFGHRERLVDAANLTIGGSGAIFACAAARLGLSTAFIGVVGDDYLGRFILDGLAERGVDIERCILDPGLPTGLSVILSRGDDRAILTAPGTVTALRAELVDRDLVRSARHIHVSSYFLQSGLRPGLPKLFDEAHAAGSTTSVDPNWDPAEEWDAGLFELLPRTDFFFPESGEARMITGVDDIDVAAEVLAGRGPVCGVKFGQGGGLVYTREEVRRIEAVPVEVVDTTGAGDSFDAGFLAGVLRGWSLERSLGVAVACASLSTRASGGTDAQATLEEALSAAGGTA